MKNVAGHEGPRAGIPFLLLKEQRPTDGNRSAEEGVRRLTGTSLDADAWTMDGNPSSAEQLEPAPQRGAGSLLLDLSVGGPSQVRTTFALANLPPSTFSDGAFIQSSSRAA